MAGIELLALGLGIVNGAVIAIRPFARFHSRLDVVEARLVYIEAALDRLERAMAKAQSDD